MHEAAAEIEATAVVPAAPEEVFEFLSDLSNHWRLVDKFVKVISVDGDAGLVRLQGPLGVHRTVRTHVTAARGPEEIEGVAELAGGTRARVCWTLSSEAGGESTRVRLAAEVLTASAFDRLLLALGGRVWMRRRFAFGLERLASLVGAGAGAAIASPTPRQSRPRAGDSAPPSPSPPDPAYPSARGSS